MNRIANVGSMNIDHVYQVPHFVRPGETLDSLTYKVFAGGKGFNQSLALARAGARVAHIGCIGADGEWLKALLKDDGVDVAHVLSVAEPTGHAIIQVDASGENSIILHGGANRSVSSAFLKQALADFGADDILLLQNETSCVADAIRLAHARKMKVVFNPAPFSGRVPDYPLDLVSVFILNETEAEGLTGSGSVEDICRCMRERYPAAAVVLTLGSRGAVYCDAGDIVRQDALKVKAVDTTAAGDTFIGYFLAALSVGETPVEALAQGCRAAAVCVTKPGASISIPRHEELPNAKTA